MRQTLVQIVARISLVAVFAYHGLAPFLVALLIIWNLR
jgi:hypothetical protein